MSEDHNEENELSVRENKWEWMRIQILNCSHELFLEKGVLETSMNDIAIKLGVSKGTIYNYVIDRNDLLLAIAAKGYNKLTQKFLEQLEITKPGIDQVFQMGMAYHEFHDEYPYYFEVFSEISKSETSGEIPHITSFTKNNKGNVGANMMKEMQKSIVLGRKDELRNKIEYNLALMEFVMLWRQIIKKAMDIQSIRDDIDVTLIAQALAAISSGIHEQIKAREPLLIQLGFKPNQLKDVIYELIRNGLKKQ